MRALFLLFFFVNTTQLLIAQDNVGIGILNPHPSSILELNSQNKGILITRMDSTQRNAIANPAQGLLVYDTSYNQFWFFDGIKWVMAIGPQGPVGPQGMQGIQGLAGADGAQGPQGIAGPQGLQGIPGLNGADGAQGPQGVQGLPGIQGIPGLNGVDGAQGPQGPVGAQGILGATGPQGIQGVPGATGSQGIQGIPGATGPIGATGPVGPAGPSGSATLTVGAQYYSTGRQVYVSSTASGAAGTGSTFSWVVPSGVSQIRVQLAGGGGGGGYSSSGDATSGACGGFVIGELGVTAGETLTIFAGAGGTGFSSGNNFGRGGTGSSIARGSTILGGAGGGGGGASNGFTDGNGGGMAYGLSLNGGNGTSSNAGSSGNNYVSYLWNSHAYIGKNSVGGTINQAGVSARFFTTLFDSGTNYGFGGQFGSGTRGVVIIEW